MLDLSSLVSTLNPRILQVQDEGSFLPQNITYSGDGKFVEDDIPEIMNQEYESVIFVDSRRRTFEAISIEGFVMLFSQIVTGALIYSDGLCQPLFSPVKSPESKFVLAIPEVLANLFHLLDGDIVAIDEIPAIVAIGSTAERALDSFMQKMEKQVVEKYLGKSVVIKDGAIDFVTPAFQPNIGPVGLVKNIERAYVELETFLSFGRMKAGERSKCIRAKLSTHDYERVMTYLKITDSPGLNGLVRLEVVVNKDDFEALKKEIFRCFNLLAKIIPKLTADAPFLPRMPENIFPVSYLEKCLEKFFYDRNYVHWSVIKTLKL